MRTLKDLTRPNVWRMKAYSSARDEYTGTDGIFLDANENPYGELNRYPDPHQRKLKEEISKRLGFGPEQIFVGNGSDETIDLAYRIFCEPGQDKALTFYPSYGMYDTSAALNDVELIKVPLDQEFQIDFQALHPHLTDPRLKLIFLCSPNNPTGNLMDRTTVEQILQTFPGIVIIDEAYINFSSEKSALSLLEKYPNLIVSRTFSKDYGLAGARVGMAFGSAEIMNLFRRVKPPYNVSELNQNAALEAVLREELYRKNLQVITREKERLERALLQLDLIKHSYPTVTNFLLVEVPDAVALYDYLIKKQIILRLRHTQIPNTVRITIGTPEENNQLLQALRSYQPTPALERPFKIHQFKIQN